MKRILKQTLALASLVLLSGGAFAQLTGVAATPHNLSTSQTVGNRVTAGVGADQICVFCHTPHGSSSGADQPPLWNRSTTPAANYQLYASTTMDGTAAGVGSVSAACLSCHDGTQAMNSMLNAPGSGNPATGGWTWSGGAATADPVGSIGNVFGNLGTDLRNDHPIGIPYCGGGITAALNATTVSGACADPDFVTAADRLRTANIGGQQVFWVEVGTVPNTTRNKTDIILYNRGAVPSVECASCHDPHTVRANANEVHFMRVTTAASAICLACHVK